MYQKNAEVFQEYFEDLKMYYDKGNLNPADSTASFFTSMNIVFNLNPNR